jgi:FG-GAP-like repeat
MRKILFVTTVLFGFIFYFSSACTNKKKIELSEGKKLAQTLCSSCHAFPDPSLLDKNTWVSTVLPKMADFINVEGMYDPYSSSIMSGNQNPTRVMPPPGISLDNWKKIINWFESAAPEKPLERKEQLVPIKTFLPHFITIPLSDLVSYPVTTFLKIDTLKKGFFLGDGSAEQVFVFNKNIKVVDSFFAPIGITDLNIRPGGIETISMGSLKPPDSRLGKLVRITEKNKTKHYSVILDSLERPVNATYADLNQDGKEDIIISEFGFRTGYLNWYENVGKDKYKKHLLRGLPGAVKTVVYDFNKDGKPDIIALMAQADEGVFIYYNEGLSKFREERVLTFPPVYGSNSLQLFDFNKDGFMDILTTNGDNADYSIIPKAYHGIRVFLNNGSNQFKETIFLPVYGAQKVIAADFDNDGDIDLASISFFPDYKKFPLESFIYWQNKGDNTFERYSFPQATDGRWMTMDAGDIDGDGDIDIILGSAIFSMGTIPQEIRNKWLSHPLSGIILENTTIKK